MRGQPIVLYGREQIQRDAERTEPVFLNVYGARESIPRNEFRQSMWPGGSVRQPYS